MIKKLILLLAFLVLPISSALSEYKYNPLLDSTLDYYDKNVGTASNPSTTYCFDSDTCFILSGNTLTLTVHGTTRQTWTTAVTDSFFLLNTGDFLLLNTGDKLILN